MAFRDEELVLRERCARLEEELAGLREELARADASLAERFKMSWPTHDPDLRQFHTHGGIHLGMIALGLFGTAFVLAFFGNIGSLFVAGLGAAVIQLRSIRTVVDRRRRAFATRFPWSPSAYVVKHPLESLTVQRHVNKSKGNTTITYQLRAGEHIVADGSTQADAERLAQEVRDFVGLASSP